MVPPSKQIQYSTVRQYYYNDHSRWVPHGHVLGRSARGAQFLGGPLLNGNGVARRQRQIHGRQGRRHVDGHPVRLCGDRQPVRANLVGRVAVGGDAVGAHHDGRHFVVAHVRRRHAVANQRGARQIILQALKTGETGALVVGPRLERHDLGESTPGVQRPHDSQGRPVGGRRQRARVANGHDGDTFVIIFTLLRVLENGVRSVRSQGPTVAFVAPQHEFGVLDDRLHHALGGTAAVVAVVVFGPQHGVLDFLQRIKQIDRGGSTGGQIVHFALNETVHGLGRVLDLIHLLNLGEFPLGRVVLQVHRQAQDGHHRDCRQRKNVSKGFVTNLHKWAPGREGIVLLAYSAALRESASGE